MIESERLLGLVNGHEAGRGDHEGRVQGQEGGTGGREAKVGQRLEQVTAAIKQGEDDLERALQVSNELPVLWSKAGVDERRAILEAVFVRFVVDGKRIVDFEVRPPYSWLVRWKPQARGCEMPNSSAARLTPAAD